MEWPTLSLYQVRHTGGETSLKELETVKQNTVLPVLLGSGITTENIHNYHSLADGFIVGSHFKTDGKANNLVEEKRVEDFMDKFKSL